MKKILLIILLLSLAMAGISQTGTKKKQEKDTEQKNKNSKDQNDHRKNPETASDKSKNSKGGSGIRTDKSDGNNPSGNIFMNDNNAGTSTVSPQSVNTYEHSTVNPQGTDKSKAGKAQVNDEQGKGAKNLMKNESYDDNANDGINTPSQNTNTITTQDPTKQTDNPDPNINDGRKDNKIKGKRGKKKEPIDKYKPVEEKK